MFQKYLTTIFSQVFLEIFPELHEKYSGFKAEVVPSTQEKFGHYQCNSAMRIAKLLGKNPREVATAATEKLLTFEKDGYGFSKLEIAGPGFINITLENNFIAAAAEKVLLHPHFGIPFPEKKQRIIVDFSSPNVAKEMHVGHLRSTIIGDSIANLFEFLGHDVLRINHLGDWGTAYGMLITHIRESASEVLEEGSRTDLSALVNWYRESKKRFDEDPEFKKRAQLQVVALQSGDAVALKAWHIICHISQIAYKEIYELLDVKITDRGESFYNPFLAEIIADLEKKDLLELSNGAKCLFLEGFTNREGEALPLILQKSDGGYNYATTDMATIRHRIQEEKGERIIYVVDAGQSQHFQMLFKAAEKAGYLNPSQVRVEHVPFGLVLGSDGKKFRTRSGETERLIDLLTTAIIHAKKILEERNSGISESDCEKTAKILGLAAVKYADLSCHRQSDYAFSYEKMLRFEGNTAAFLLYSYVRINGIKRKTGVKIEEIIGKSTIELKHLSEISLALHICRFDEALSAMAEDLLPNRLCEYLYELAERFNAFFRDCRVEGSLEQNSRLLLCEATAKVLQQGLKILGINTLEKM